MKRKVIDVIDCNDCAFTGYDDNGSEYCALDNEFIEHKTTPYKIGKHTLIHKENCFLKKHTVTFKLKKP